MKKHKDLKAVCFVASTYSMLMYLLVYGKEQFDLTFFFVSDAISPEVQSKLKYKEYLSYLKMIKKSYFIRIIYRFGLYCTSYFKWPFLRTLPIYGGDHLWFTPALLHKRSMVVLEDGLANYDVRELVKTSLLKHKWIYKLLFGPSICEGEYGYSKYASQLILTNIGSIPACVEHKVKLIDIRNLWETCNAKEYVLDLFGFEKSDIEKLRTKKVIILTQPYNVDVGDEVMREIYQDIIDQHETEDVVIKTHPRDYMDYKGMFPHVMVYSQKMPAELFALMGIKFTDVYTIDSTAIYSFPKDCNLHYLGYKCHPVLLKRYGQSTIQGPAQN